MNLTPPCKHGGCVWTQLTEKWSLSGLFYREYNDEHDENYPD